MNGARETLGLQRACSERLLLLLAVSTSDSEGGPLQMPLPTGPFGDPRKFIKSPEQLWS